MKSRTASRNSSSYPAISSSYWQPAPVPSPYLVPGINVLVFFFCPILRNRFFCNSVSFFLSAFFEASKFAPLHDSNAFIHIFNLVSDFQVFYFYNTFLTIVFVSLPSSLITFYVCFVV